MHVAQDNFITGEIKPHDSQTGSVVWHKGLNGAGKSSIALAHQRALFKLSRHGYMLDEETPRRGLCSDFGGSPEDSPKSIRRVSKVARLSENASLVCITARISSYGRERKFARRTASIGCFLEVYLNAPLEVCAQRDPKDLYTKAPSGAPKNFTSISARCETLFQSDVELRSDQFSVAKCANVIPKGLQQLEG